MCEMTTTLNVVFLHLWIRYTIRHVFVSTFTHASDLSRKCVFSVVSLVLLLKWLHHTEIKSPPSHPVSFLAGKY